MFECIGPVQAADAQRIYIDDHGSKIDPDLKAKIQAANRAISPFDTLLPGLELLYVVATEKVPTDAAAKTATLQTLGVVATRIGVGQYGGPAKRDRAWALADWAAWQLDPVGPEPAAPEVDPAYTTIPPPPPE